MLHKGVAPRLALILAGADYITLLRFKDLVVYIMRIICFVVAYMALGGKANVLCVYYIHGLRAFRPL
jgi:hypothetical protein